MEVKILDRSRFIAAMKEQLKIDSKTTAFLAIDMHQGHLDPQIGTMLVPEDERQRVLTHAKKLVGIAREYKIPIIHAILQLRPIESQNPFNPFSGPARRVNQSLPPEERSWTGNPPPRDGRWEPKIMPEVAPGPGDYVINNKKTYSAYLGTDLEHLLRTLKVEAVAIFGINTNTCDLCACYETVNRGFKLVVISDCVASSYGKDLHIFALQNIARSLGWVLTLSEFEEKLKAGS